MTFTLRLEGERPLRLNKLYAGVNHWTRKREADRVHELVVSSLYGEPSASIAFPVHVRMTLYARKFRGDVDGLHPKMYLDGLVLAGVLPDDSRRYVSSYSVAVEDGDDALEIALEEAMG